MFFKVIACLYFSLFFVLADPSIDPSGVTDAEVSMASICDAENSEEVIEMTNQCLVDPIMNRGISDCRSVAYGTGDQIEAKNVYCAKSAPEKVEMDELFEVCLDEAGITTEAIQTEWVANCGFCERPDLVLKTEECFTEGHVKREWIACRLEVFGTADPVQAANKYCEKDPLGKLTEDQRFDECLAGKNISKEEFDAALTNCSEEEEA